MPVKFTQQGQEAGSRDLPLSVDDPPSCRGPPPVLARALFQDRWECGPDMGTVRGGEEKVWVFGVIEEVGDGETG